MVILDTNVLSELMRPAPSARVVAWLDAQPAESVWITSITVLELRSGLALLPDGKRKRSLELGVVLLLREDLENRVLDFDVAASVAAARIAVEHRHAGRVVDVRDIQIAGITIARRGVLATRNVKHFEGIDMPVVDPWAA